ncbi:GGDEF and EAL domain-containing protein [Sandaracinus amylolyticus]|uniref:GGDEF and EAL domain-containing protein n=1 Tax=Sandaracinus amylolyticus TaxID=927083 RepID=UPI001F266F30|nr:GGDEF and EAL domain-containing protein [Sandaracinus amylolyticus]UJR84725.1 Hypothetical protein I5071_68040 [Sandaracinus amylolyticus]
MTVHVPKGQPEVPEGSALRSIPPALARVGVDPLTGLPGHHALHAWLERAIARCEVRDRPVSVVVLDLDRFGEVNRIVGHTSGDDVMREIARALEHADGDLPADAGAPIIVRSSGDEFAALLAGWSREEAVAWADRKRAAIASLRFLAGHTCSASAGVATYPVDAPDARELVVSARAALRVGKREGRNCTLAYQPAHDGACGIAERVVHALLERRGARALAFVHQPIVRASDHEIVACEALCRPRLERYASPAALFAAAAASDVVWEIGRLVRSVATEPLRRDPSLVPLFLNLHPHELADPTLVDPEGELRALAPRVVLEIGECARLSSLDAARATIDRLHTLGFRVALDDLGAGYATLRWMSELDLDYVKLDRTLIADLDGSAARRTLVQALIEFAHQRGQIVVAEGVETEAERDALAGLGCDLLQGWLFGRGTSQVPRLPSEGEKR